MQYNVAQLLKEPVGGTRKYEVNEEVDDLDPLLVIQRPLTGKVKFTKILDGVLVTGDLETVVEVNCDRCLEPVDVPVEIELEEEFRQTMDIHTGASLPVTDESDPATLIDDKNHLDLSEVVRQALLLELPTHPLCRDDCKGLCQNCGQNLNEANCDCPEEDDDPRWSSLRALLDTPDTQV